MYERSYGSGGSSVGPGHARTQRLQHILEHRFNGRYLTDHQMARLVTLRRRLGRPERPWYP